MKGALTDLQNALNSLNRQLTDIEQEIASVQTILQGYQNRKQEIDFEVQVTKKKIFDETNNLYGRKQ